ncbi:MAG: undecaprenyl/decaprenyl-phosphate alpha-N-acetylglucosaminyl 1-phosphate transferase [Planctomycetota bacterium]|nr:undecaprenyl/decaprenyl-phosphate alpha-N-acetylglucosaminyl 1-phosphate transferase [Planctomycetota bacterium]
MDLFFVFSALSGIGLLLALALTPLARRLALRYGLLDAPGERKIHSQPMPYGGGIAIYGAVMLAVAGLYALGLAAASPALCPDWLRPLCPYLGGLRLAPTMWKLTAILAGGTVVFALGVVDDIYRLGPGVKFLVQIAAACLTVAGGVRATCFLSEPLLGSLVTVIWIVGITNAFNFIDNMDGLATGVAAIASGLFLVVALQGGQIFVAAFLAVFAGALLGFLRYNFPPARIFLGDAGSLFIGFTLGALTVACTYYEGGRSVAAVFMPLLILGIPVFDMISVICVRWQQGKPLWQGDTNHFSHRLVRLGMSRREAVLAIYLLGLIMGANALTLRWLDNAGAFIVVGIAAGVFLFIGLLEYAAMRAKSE